MLKLRNFAILGAVPLTFVAMAASCGQSDNSPSENTPNQNTSAVTNDWFEEPFVPRNNPSKIELLSLNESITALETQKKEMWNILLRYALSDRLDDPENKKWGKSSSEAIAKIKSENLQIKDFGIEVSGIPKLMTNVLSEIIRLVWNLTGFQTHAIINPSNVIQETLRLSNNDLSAYSKLLQIFNNYQNPDEKTSDPTKNVWYSWATLIHFVRIAFDPTPDGQYPYEGLIAMLKPLGKAAVVAFNDNMAKKWEVVDGKPTGGYDADKLDLTPRKQKK